MPIDIILTSTFTRAKDKAEIIAKKLDLKIGYDLGLIEIKRPQLSRVGKQTIWML